jgi:hypothetical protein
LQKKKEKRKNKKNKNKKCSCKPLMIDKKVDDMGSINEESN